MIESPLLKELMADGKRRSIVRVLVARFGPGARQVRSALNTITDDKQLDELTGPSGTCPDLETFK
jgi:hypothetical protein